MDATTKAPRHEDTKKDMKNKAFVLPEMTWAEAEEALAQAEVALVPVGSFEQHGPNGTFELDTGRD